MTEMTGHRQRRSEKAGQRGLRKVDVKMNDIEKIYESMGIDTEVYAYGKSVLEELEERFRAVDETADYNQLKVLKAMQ